MNHPFSHRRLGDILLGNEFINQAQVDAALRGKGRLGEVLLGDNVITPEQLAKVLAEQCNLPYGFGQT
jgi:hypothetical protein